VVVWAEEIVFLRNLGRPISLESPSAGGDYYLRDFCEIFGFIGDSTPQFYIL